MLSFGICLDDALVGLSFRVIFVKVGISKFYLSQYKDGYQSKTKIVDIKYNPM